MRAIAKIRSGPVSLLLLAGAALADSSLSPFQRIASEKLGYDLQYQVYQPAGRESGGEYPVLFVTDGPMYIDRGRVPRVLDRLIRQRRIEPVVAVFIDVRDPDDPSVNRRNRQFACSEDYYRFFADELIPTIESEYPVRRNRDARTILGVSFGGLNAACFGLMGYETFSGIAMHSPATHPVPGLLPAYEAAPLLPLKIFLSTGSQYDNTRTNREFRSILRDKGYELKYLEVPKGHDWSNWRPLIDDVLLFFYGAAGDGR